MGADGGWWRTEELLCMEHWCTCVCCGTWSKMFYVLWDYSERFGEKSRCKNKRYVEETESLVLPFLSKGVLYLIPSEECAGTFSSIGDGTMLFGPLNCSIMGRL